MVEEIIDVTIELDSAEVVSDHERTGVTYAWMGRGLLCDGKTCAQLVMKSRTTILKEWNFFLKMITLKEIIEFQMDSNNVYVTS